MPVLELAIHFRDYWYYYILLIYIIWNYLSSILSESKRIHFIAIYAFVDFTWRFVTFAHRCPLDYLFAQRRFSSRRLNTHEIRLVAYSIMFLLHQIIPNKTNDVECIRNTSDVSPKRFLKFYCILQVYSQKICDGYDFGSVSVTGRTLKTGWGKM